MCDLNNDWPNGRAIFYNNDLSLVVKINEEDHMDIQFSRDKTFVDDFFKKFNKISADLEEKLNFSMDEKLGYVTTLPDNLGTSFKIQTIMNAPHIKSKTDISSKPDDIRTQQ